MVDQRGEVHHLFGNEQAEMAQLRGPLYCRLPVEQTDELVS